MYFHWGLEIDTEMSFVSVEASGTRSEIGVVVDPNAPWERWLNGPLVAKCQPNLTLYQQSFTENKVPSLDFIYLTTSNQSSVSLGLPDQKV